LFLFRFCFTKCSLHLAMNDHKPEPLFKRKKELH
jgi:hypothetical protein